MRMTRSQLSTRPLLPESLVDCLRSRCANTTSCPNILQVHQCTTALTRSRGQELVKHFCLHSAFSSERSSAKCLRSSVNALRYHHHHYSAANLVHDDFDGCHRHVEVSEATARGLLETTTKIKSRSTTNIMTVLMILQFTIMSIVMMRSHKIRQRILRIPPAIHPKSRYASAHDQVTLVIC